MRTCTRAREVCETAAPHCGDLATLCVRSHYTRDVRALVLCLLVAAAGSAACSNEASSECRVVCNWQERCENQVSAVASGDTAFDVGECVAACTALERDQVTRGLVKSHAECVQKAGRDNCAAILECR